MNAKTFFSDRPIAYHPILAKVCGSVTAALFLSQLAYWNDKGNSNDGWIWKTQAEMEDETGLTRSEQETARRILKEKGILQEDRRGVPARMWYLIDWDVLTNLIDEYEQSRLRESSNLDCDKPANYSEITTKTTSEINNKKPWVETANPTLSENAVCGKKLSAPNDSQKAWEELRDALVIVNPIVMERFGELWDEYPDLRRHRFALKAMIENANPVSFRYYETCFLRYDPDKEKPPPKNGNGNGNGNGQKKKEYRFRSD